MNMKYILTLASAGLFLLWLSAGRFPAVTRLRRNFNRQLFQNWNDK